MLDLLEVVVHADNVNLLAANPPQHLQTPISHCPALVKVSFRIL
eukprot:SAG31_NODE_1510_length_8062_cov_4.204194_6_plen_44_part_00